jgi:exosome complex component RRP42
MSAMDVSNLSKTFLESLFKEGKRFDGRGPLDLNQVHIEYGVSNKAEGSARVRLGKTEVIAGVKLSIGTPYPDSPDAGNLMVSGDLLPLASPRFEMGPPGFNAIEVPRLIDRMVRESKMIDLKKLVVVPGEKVWTVMIDVYPINDDGSLVDAASIATIAALKEAKLPILNDAGLVDYEQEPKEKLPLNKDILPLSFTFYKLGESIILHPTREEEESCETKVTFGASKYNGSLVLNSCQKGWESPFTLAELEHIMDVLPGKYEELIKKLNKSFK